MKTTNTNNIGVKVVENQIEGFSFVLFNNGDSNKYQTLNIVYNGVLRPVGVIAPIDFPQLIDAICENKTLNGFIHDIKGCWTDNIIERVINELLNGLL